MSDCGCGSKRKKVLPAPNSFLVRCFSCDEPLADLQGNPQPVNMVSILANRNTIRSWITEGHDITFINPDDRAIVLLEAS